MQTDLVDRARAEMRQSKRRVLIQASTGFGKTVLAAHMIARAVERGRRCWFLVHRVELLRQSAQQFSEAADLYVGLIAAGFPTSPQAPVQVCSVQTLVRRLGALQPPDLLVLDECHHTPSKSWQAIAQTLTAAHHIGLSATPQRLDGRGLSPFFDALVCGPSTADLIAQGWLSKYRLFAPSRPDIASVHRVAGDYNRQELSAALADSTVVGDCVSHYQQHCPSARALVFAWSIGASQQIAQQFRDVGVVAEHIDGETPTAQREDAMRRFRSGELRVVVNVDLFGEGLDVPALDAVFLLRPTQSLGLYLQQVGRGLRPAPGKSHVSIFDHANNWERHGLPDDPRVWSLDWREKTPRESEPSGKRCLQCYGVTHAAAKVCPYCGVPFVVQSREVERVEGALAEANLDELRALRSQASELGQQCSSLADFQALAKKLNYRAGWAWIQWEIRRGNQRIREAQG